MSVLSSGPRSFSTRLSHGIPTQSSCSNLNSPLKNNFIHWSATKEKRKEKKFNNCAEPGVFIIPSLGWKCDLLVTSCVDLNQGPIGEPFHHFSSASSNSHDLMRCRMLEICCLCFLFSASTLSHQQRPGVHNRKRWLTAQSC